MSIVIRAEGLSKKYLLRHETGERYLALRDVIANGARSLARRLRRPFTRQAVNSGAREEFWALQDINFEIRDGERVGIIGRNGAGKSTLLKILSRITEPSKGTIRLRGRIASLLEVGTGFHPELTGRENIFLNGAILGMARAEIRARFDDIVQFADIEKFLDTPVKRFSSGMYVRLAFSVAAHLDPEILIVDEVLAVGDAEFQKKCLGKMDSVARQGRTVLFVSHNMAAVQRLCTRAILITRGRIERDGATAEVVRHYLDTVGTPGDQHGERRWELAAAPGDQVARLLAVRAVGRQSRPAGRFAIQEDWHLEVEFAVLTPGQPINVNVYVYSDSNDLLFVTGDFQTPRWDQKERPVGLHRSRCRIPGNLLNEGNLRILVGLVSPPSTLRAMVEEALFVTLTDDQSQGGARGHYPASWPGGAMRPLLSWEYEYSEFTVNPDTKAGISDSHG